MIVRAIQTMALAEGGLPIGKDGGMGLALVVLGLLVILFTVMRMRRRRQALSSPPAAAGRAEVRRPGSERGSALARGGPSAAEMSELLRSIEEIARETNARLDTKIRILEALIREADERIERLKAATAGSAGESASGGAPPELSASPPRRRQGEFEERFAEVFKLADEGLPAAEIAARTGMLSGEVELVLGLRGRERSRGQPPVSS